MTPPVPSQQLAELARDAMWAKDRACQALGMRVLADSAFAYACNAYNEVTVASGFSIDLLAPARAGDLLTARATEQHRARRTGVYDIEVCNQRGERIAAFRGRSYTLRGQAVAPLP